MHRIALALAFSLVCASAQAQWGTLRGKFVYDGAPPTAPGLQITKDVEVCGKHKLIDESLVVSKDGGIANVAVWCNSKLTNIAPEYKERSGKTIVYDNKGCRFEPHVLPLWIEEKLELHNADPIGHNTNMTPVGGGDAINPLLPPGGAAEYKFNKQPFAPVPVACNIHPWMKGYIIARDNPYVAVSKEDGSFEIKNLPVGDWEFRAWQEKSGYFDDGKFVKGKFKVKITEGDNDLGDLKIKGDLFNK